MKKNLLIGVMVLLLIFSSNIQALADTTVSVTSISLSKATDVLTVGQTDTLTATVLPSNATNQALTWVSANPSVVKVFNGVVVALSPGSAYVTVYNVDGKYANCYIIVKDQTSSISLNKTSDTLSVGSTDTLTATVTPSQSVIWTSSDTNIVTVFKGVLMALSKGTAVITATTADGSSSATCSVTVNDASAAITLNKTTDTLAVGASDTLVANVVPALPTGTYLMWMSSNPSVASVSSGVITGQSIGSTIITAIASDGSGSAACNVTVTANGKNTIRLGGANRYETSVAIAESGWPSGSVYAVLATGNDYPDALSAAPLAKKYDAPILLTDKSTIPQNILDEIVQLKTSHIFICGGTGVISQDVENKLNTMGITTERLEGKDRYETSLAIAKKMGVTTGQLISVNGYDWADALSASSIAAEMGIPVLLTDKDAVSEDLNSFLDQGSFSKTYVLGDTSLISNSVADNLPNPERIIGNTEYERNINILSRFQSSLNLTNICIATGADFPDALSGSALAAKLSSAIVLVDGNNLQSTTIQYATQNLAQTSNVYVFGLQGAVTDDILNRIFQNN